jgi:hypothetical protein
MKAQNVNSCHSPASALDRIAGLLTESGGGSLALAYDGSEWIVSILVGREAEDSLMAAGQLCGLGSTARETIETALRGAGWV